MIILYIEYISEASSKEVSKLPDYRHMSMESFQLTVSTIQEVATVELFI